MSFGPSWERQFSPNKEIDVSSKKQAALDPDLVKQVVEQLKQASEGKGFWAFLKGSATDESGNPSSSRSAMYVQLAMAIVAFGLAIFFGFTGNNTLAITFTSSAVGLATTAMGTNASAQKKSAAIVAAKEKAKQVTTAPTPQGDTPS